MPDTPDELENDSEMKKNLEDALEEAHAEESPAVDAFSTDALGNEPAEEKSTGDFD